MKKRRILLIDDDPDVIFIFKMILESNDFIVNTFNDPILAVSVYKPFYYDLILMDLKLPDISGYELYNRIRKLDDKTKICFLTASEQCYKQYRDKEFLNFNDDFFILKPIETEELIKRINKIIK